MVSSAQSVFIQGLSIHDNFQYIQGVIKHSHHSKTPCSSSSWTSLNLLTTYDGNTCLRYCSKLVLGSTGVTYWHSSRVAQHRESVSTEKLGAQSNMAGRPPITAALHPCHLIIVETTGQGNRAGTPPPNWHRSHQGTHQHIHR
jgi:hypothetical protein